MFGRIDQEAKYLGGVQHLENFIPLPQGGIVRRPGTKYLGNIGTPNARLIGFSPNSNEGYLLVLKEGTLDIYLGSALTSDLEDAGPTVAPHITPDATISNLPYNASELFEIQTTPSVDQLYFFHPNHAPHVLTYVDDSPLTFTFEEVEFTAPAFDSPPPDPLQLQFKNETRMIKLVSDNPSEFSNLTTEEYVEFRKDNEWVLAKILTQADGAPADPSGKVCYAEPIDAVVRDVPHSAKMVVLDNNYDSQIGSSNRNIRSDTLVFSYDLENAWIRVKSDYDRIRTATSSGSQYGAGGTEHGKTMWLQILEYLGPQDHPVEFISPVTRASLTVGHVYRIVKSTVDIAVGAPIDGEADPVATSGQAYNSGDVQWELAFRYTSVGENFTCQNHYKVNTGTGEVADLSTQRTFDVVRTSPEVDYYSCTGNVRIDGESTIHTGDLEASGDFFYDVSANPGGLREGQYVMCKHGAEYVTYKVTSIASATLAEVEVVDGTLPRKHASEELLNEGLADEYRISIWRAGNWPYCGEFHEQRLVLGGCPTHPETVWFSNLTDNLDFRTVENDGEVLDTTGMSYSLSGRSLNRIINLTSGATLIIGTQSSRWQVRQSDYGEPLTPKNIRVTLESSEGVSGTALRIGSSTIFKTRAGERLSEFSYNYEINGYEPTNLNILASHLFRNDPIKEFVYQPEPWSIIWVLTQCGKLYSLTYIPQQQMYSWARHTTDGVIHSIAVMPQSENEEDTDRLVLLTTRGVNNDKYFLEILGKSFKGDIDTINYLDCWTRLPDSGIRDNPQTVSPPPLPPYLPGYPATFRQLTSKGVITQASATGTSGTKWLIAGLSFTSKVTLPPLSLMLPDGPIYGERKRIVRTIAYLRETIGIKHGVGDNLQQESFRRATDPMTEIPPLFSGFRELQVNASWDRETALTIAQDQPYPCSVLALILEVER